MRRRGRPRRRRGGVDPLHILMEDVRRCRDPERPVAGPQDAAAHWGLVPFAISTIAMRWPRGVSYAEKISIGTVGLVKAARTYDPARGAFSIYAIPAIAQALFAGRSRAEGGPIGIAHGACDKSRNGPRARNGPLPRELARRILRADFSADPTDEILPAREEEDQLAEEEERSRAIARVRAAVAALAPDRRSLVEGMMAGRTLRDLGDERGITAEAVRMRLERIFRDMRDRLGDLEPLLPRARAIVRVRFDADPGSAGDRAHGPDG